jgi:hypothetical protein
VFSEWTEAAKAKINNVIKTYHRRRNFLTIDASVFIFNENAKTLKSSKQNVNP